MKNQLDCRSEHELSQRVICQRKLDSISVVLLFVSVSCWCVLFCSNFFFFFVLSRFILELIDACRSFPGLSKFNRVTFEYVMLKDVNDSDEDAHRLVALIRDFPSLVNIMCAFSLRLHSFFDLATFFRIQVWFKFHFRILARLVLFLLFFFSLNRGYFAEIGHMLMSLLSPSYPCSPFNPWPGSQYVCSSNNRIHRFSEIIEGIFVHQSTISSWSFFCFSPLVFLLYLLRPSPRSLFLILVVSKSPWQRRQPIWMCLPSGQPVAFFMRYSRILYRSPPFLTFLLLITSFSAANIPAPIRWPRGRDILAACGQLKSTVEEEARRSVLTL